VGSIPAPPLEAFERTCDVCLKRRQNGRRLWTPSLGRMFQRRSELVELDLIRVLLRRVRALVRVREPGLPLRRPADLARGIVLDESGLR
jgi:hypothetical protein